MKSIAIFRHHISEGPGYFAEFLDECTIPWQLVRIDANDAVPQDASAYSGLVFMGGPMSVNDDLPWIPKALALIRQAVARDIPVLGHCLGGQLMARALGGVVTMNAVKEIGWGQVKVTDNDTAHAWFGDTKSFAAFHWHGETFSLPHGAAHILSSAHCINQAYAMGKHLGLQCHVEMTEQMIRDWCIAGKNEIAANVGSQAVQTGVSIEAQIADRLPELHFAARQVYRHWIAGLAS